VEAVRKPYAFVGFGACFAILNSLLWFPNLFVRHFHVKNCEIVPGYAKCWRVKYGQTKWRIARCDKDHDQKYGGASMERRLIRPCAVLTSLGVYTLICTAGRNVAFVDIITVWIGEVSKSGSEHQHPSDDPTVRTYSSSSVYCTAVAVLEVFGIRMDRGSVVYGLVLHYTG
jgi:hypothetical protein